MTTLILVGLAAVPVVLVIGFAVTAVADLSHGFAELADEIRQLRLDAEDLRDAVETRLGFDLFRDGGA